MYLQDNQILLVKPSTNGKVIFALRTQYESGPIQVELIVSDELTEKSLIARLNDLREFNKTVTFGLNYGIGGEKLAKALKQ